MGNEDEVEVLKTKIVQLEADRDVLLAGSRGDFMKKCMAGGKSFKECAGMWDSEQEAKMSNLTKERDEAKTKLEQLELSVQQTELTRLSDGIKALDKGFKVEDFLKDISDFTTKKIVLSKHLEVLQGIKSGSVRLSVDNTDAQGDVSARLNKTSQEMFGFDLDKVAKNIVGIKEEKA